jgi:hypothetical protein
MNMSVGKGLPILTKQITKTVPGGDRQDSIVIKFADARTDKNVTRVKFNSTCFFVLQITKSENKMFHKYKTISSPF